MFLDAEEAKSKRNDFGPPQVAMYAPQQRPEQRRVRCFECGRFGHQRRNCPDAREAERPEYRVQPGEQRRDVAMVTRQNGARSVRIPLEELSEDYVRDVKVQRKDVELNGNTEKVHSGKVLNDHELGHERFGH